MCDMMERVKVAYVDLLCAWRLHLQAVRVRKYCSTQTHTTPLCTNGWLVGYRAVVSALFQISRTVQPNWVSTVIVLLVLFQLILRQYTPLCGPS